MQTASAIIDSLGGTSAVAAGLSLTPSTVSSWKTSGRIPSWRQPSLLALARRVGASLKPSDFPGSSSGQSEAA
uniref:carph-isopro domain-containing protein n=1 Tax=Sphingomonas abietis TaxID=3012344 RepID=UPI00389A489C